MNTVAFLAPCILVLLSNTTYHFISKTVNPNLNPFAGLVATYGVSLVVCFLMLLATKQNTIIAEFSQLRLSNYIMGLAVIGIELGYILMYRKGFDISSGALIINISLAVLLFFIGIFYFHEHISPTKIVGILFCIAGIFLVTHK